MKALRSTGRYVASVVDRGPARLSAGEVDGKVLIDPGLRAS